jgi:hypothetical protein
MKRYSNSLLDVRSGYVIDFLLLFSDPFDGKGCNGNECNKYSGDEVHFNS